MKKFLLLLTMFFLFFSCNVKKNNAENKLKVVTTLNYFSNLVEEIAKDKVEIEGLMKEGEDPHLYIATAGDIKKIDEADLIVYGGLHLEGKMVDILENIKNENINLSNSAPKDKLIVTEEGIYDPHIWFDMDIWALEAKSLTEKLSLLDEKNKDFYNSNLEKYLVEIENTKNYIKERIEEIPKESRYLITAHDAFNYYSREFGLEVKSIQGISTASEIGTKEINDLANFIVTHNIKAIFTESSVNPKSIEALREAVKSKGGEVKIGGELYSDSMGDKLNNTETYLKTIKANTDIIVDALK